MLPPVRIEVSARDFAAILAALEGPARPPSEKLLEAVRAYRDAVTSGRLVIR